MRKAAIGSLVLLVLSCAGVNAATNRVEFSASRVRLLGDGKERPVAAVCVAGDRIRVAPVASAREVEEFVIYRRDRGVVWHLYPGTARYTESALSEADWQSELTMHDAAVAQSTNGTEAVEGLPCTRLFVVVDTDLGGEVYRSTNAVWVADELGLPIKVVRRSGSGMAMRGIVKGAQSPALFEIPAGYVKATNHLETLTAAPSPTDEPEPPGQPVDSMHKPFNVKSFRQKFGMGY